MKRFIYKNGKPDHQKGYHDDLIMALAMALWVFEKSFNKLTAAAETSKAMLSAWTMGSAKEETEVTENNTSFTGKVPGKKNKIYPKPNFSHYAARNMQDPNGDFLWLFR